MKGNAKIACKPKEGSRPPRASRLEAVPTSRPSWITGEEGQAEELWGIRTEGHRTEGLGRWAEGKWGFQVKPPVDGSDAC